MIVWKVSKTPQFPENASCSPKASKGRLSLPKGATTMAFDESKHPRDEEGKFTDGNGVETSGKHTKSPQKPFNEFVEERVETKMWERRLSIAKEYALDDIDRVLEEIEEGEDAPDWYEEGLTEAELIDKYTKSILEDFDSYKNEDAFVSAYDEIYDEVIDEESDKYDDFKYDLEDALDDLVDELNADDEFGDIEIFDEESHSIYAGNIVSHYYHIQNGNNTVVIRTSNGHNNGRGGDDFDLDYRDGLDEETISQIKNTLREKLSNKKQPPIEGGRFI